jgi:hypothetical protein
MFIGADSRAVAGPLVAAQYRELPTVCSLSACIAAELGVGTPAEKHLTAELTFPLLGVSFGRPAFAA